MLERACFSDPWSEDAIRDSITNPLYTFLVAREGGRTVGYVGAYTVVGEMQITNVAVSPAARRQGVGNRLIGELVRQASEQQARLITLEVRASNRPAIALYEKLGFTEVGVRRGFYSHPTEDGILMTLYLP
jgi:ribosomal-protein-alanine N-acetyltransferase